MKKIYYAVSKKRWSRKYVMIGKSNNKEIAKNMLDREKRVKGRVYRLIAVPVGGRV